MSACGRDASGHYYGEGRMPINRQFDPYEHLVRNADGVLELDPEQGELQRAFNRYLAERNEDARG